MEILPLFDFIVIDDDNINNIICQKLIQEEVSDADIQTFLYPEDGLEYLNSKYSQTNSNKVVLLLDINMPSMNGWEVLDAINGFNKKVKEKLVIYMLTSSLDPNDKKKAAKMVQVSGYFEKPLSTEKIEFIMEQHQDMVNSIK